MKKTNSQNQLHKGDGYELGIFNQFGLQFPAHFHDYWLVGHLSGGVHELWLQNGRHVLDESSILLLNPGDVHACMPLGGCGRWLALHISASLLRRQGFAEAKIFTQPLVASPGLLKDFLGLIRKLEIEGVADAPLPAGFLANFAECSRSSRRLPLKEAPLNLPDFSEAGSLPTLKELASGAGMDKFQFLRQFRNRHGLSPHRYLVNLRLNRARGLLAAGMEMAEVAQATGFYDQSHFAKSFKASMGFTPGQYRESSHGGKAIGIVGKKHEG